MRLPDLLTLSKRRPDLRALLGALSFTRHSDADYRALAETQRRKRKPKVFSKWSQCYGKKKYPTLEAARKAARRMGKPGLTWYECVHCGTSHVGRTA